MIEIGDVVTIDREIFALEHRGRKATVLEVREETREPSGAVYYHYRLDLKDPRKGEWYEESQLLPEDEQSLDLETKMRRWSQRFPHYCDYEAMQKDTQREDLDDMDDEDTDLAWDEDWGEEWEPMEDEQ